MVRWAGWLVVLYGVAHTVGALAVEGAARHAGAWFGGELWGQSFRDMSPEMSAWWFSGLSFGPPAVLLGVLVLWLDRRGVVPPAFVGWAVIAWIAVGFVVGGPGVGQDVIPLVAAVLLLIAAHRARGAGVGDRSGQGSMGRVRVGP